MATVFSDGPLYPTAYNVVTTPSPDGQYLLHLNDYDYMYGVGSRFTLRNILTGNEQVLSPPNGLKNSLSKATFSADGSKIFFRSYVSGNEVSPIFIQNLQTGELKIGNSNSAGEISNKDSWGEVSFSADGRYFVFATEADNLIAGDTNGMNDVFRKDLSTGEVRLVSEKSNGGISQGVSYSPTISPDGRYVGFIGDRAKLVPEQYPAGSADVGYLIKDMQTGEVRLLDKDLSLRSQVNIAFSGDGSKIAYSGFKDSAQSVQVYLQDNVARTVTAVSTPQDLNSMGLVNYPAPAGNYLYAISSDGTKVTYGYVDKPNSWNFNLYMQKNLSNDSVYPLYFQYPRLNSYIEPTFETISINPDGNSGIATVHVRSENGVSINKTVTLQVNGGSGLSGDDILIPNNVNEVLVGGLGDDVYYVTPIGAVVHEQANAGVDTVVSLLADYELPENVENLQLGGITTFAGGDFSLNAKNGTGNALNNIIRGNDYINNIQAKEGNDTIYGTNGSDVINGGSGVDKVIYGGMASSHVIKGVDGGILINKTFSSTQDFLQGVERIQFYDLALTSSADINASQAYRIYQAAFDRKPDAGSLGFWVKQIDNGSTLETIATGFMQSAEFKSKYGENPSNNVLVEKFYQNVLHRAPDAGGLNYWTNLLDAQQLSGAQVLASFSESPENQAALVGVLDAWFSFTPYS